MTPRVHAYAKEILEGRISLGQIWAEVTDEEHSAIAARVQRAREGLSRQRLTQEVIRDRLARGAVNAEALDTRLKRVFLDP